MKKAMLVFGTRPEAIKMAPLVKELQSRNSFDVKVCVTAQHREMLDQVLEIFDIEPDFDINIMQQGQTLTDITVRVLRGVEQTLQQEEPDILLVHGDTSTTMASALSAYYNGITVGHVEAGLRTYDKYSPYPEEVNRQVVGSVADFHFSPTELSRSNLLNEGKNKKTVWVTGNTAIDAMDYTVADTYENEILDWVGDHKLILLTAHRRENLGEPMLEIFAAVKSLIKTHQDIKVVFPVHLNPIVQKAAKDVLDNIDRVRLINPLDVRDFHNFMARSHIILTDSGGVQEEAPSLGKPVLVMRDTTERPEGIDAGTLVMVGTNKKAIEVEVNRLLTDENYYSDFQKAVNPYGDGTASKQIADILEKNL